MAFAYACSTVVFAVLFFGGADAFWRLSCSNIQYGRIDPLVNYGGVAAHVHTAQGGSNWGVNATFESLVNSECSTCEVQDDKSAYWTPLLYYQYPNGSFINVHQGGAVAYYLARGNNIRNAVPFPAGLRMISGDAAARAYNPNVRTYRGFRPQSDAVSWACLSVKPGPETYNISNTDCYAGLRGQLHFQTCWDGVNLYKPDQSHVAYMHGIDNGDCPPTHPVSFVHLFLEVSYSVNTVKREEGGRFVLSTGDTTGYSFHGDFQNGWNETTLRDATAQCMQSNSTGSIQECEPLMRSHIRNAPSRCPMKPSTIDERVTGLLDKLPGCINVQSGPERAQPSDMNCPPSVPKPRIIPTPDSTPLFIREQVRGQPFGLPGFEYVGCSNDTQNSKRILSGRSFSADNMTVEWCQSYCTTNGFKYAGLEVGKECYCDNYLLNNPTWKTGTISQQQCYWQCTGDKNTFCGGASTIDIYNNTAIPAVPLPTVMRASGTYGYKGCWTEPGGGGRALNNGSQSLDTMTPQVCQKFCLSRGLKWFGVEYGRECYCGDRLHVNSTRVDESQCSMTCKGNKGNLQAYCGGPGRMNLYYSATL